MLQLCCQTSPMKLVNEFCTGRELRAVAFPGGPYLLPLHTYSKTYSTTCIKWRYQSNGSSGSIILISKLCDCLACRPRGLAGTRSPSDTSAPASAPDANRAFTALNSPKP